MMTCFEGGKLLWGSGGVLKGCQATRVDFCASRPSRGSHSLVDAFGPMVKHFLDLRKQQLFGCRIWFSKRGPVEIAKICETIRSVHSALSDRMYCLIRADYQNLAIGSQFIKLIGSQGHSQIAQPRGEPFQLYSRFVPQRSNRVFTVRTLSMPCCRIV